MDLIGFIQVFNIVVIAIGTLLYMCCRSLTFSSSTSSSGAADSVAAVDDNDDDVNIPPPREKHDVFISFRGEDTRETFTSHLHAALRGKKIETYIDYKLTKGDEFGPALLEAIENSRLSVIIFSKNYASSAVCLIELAHILKCRKNHGQMVVPIFYDTSPSDVKKQEGSYGVAFAQHENCEDTRDKVIGWKAALVEAVGLSAFRYPNKKGTEADFIDKVVEDISTKLKRETSYGLKGMFAIESGIEQVESLLSTNDWQGVYTVGIWGMGGIGKTTLARAVLNRLSSNFEAACFLKNVREKSEQMDGADQLQKTLLREILGEENLSIDKKNVRERLSRTKVLIVFDDVSDWRQIKDLAGDNLHYGDGSRIIVTSRERSVLKKAVSDEKYIYQLEKLNTDDARRLFQFHAFKDNSPSEEYTELSARAVKYAGGIPLALEVLGSLFFECESKDEWEDALSKLRNYPNEEIQNTFRVSYNRLQRNEKEVFLDIACFYKGWRIEDVKKMVDFGQMHGGSCAADGIRVLRDRSLISIDSEWKAIEMHDLVQETGQAIVCEQCIEEPGKRSRLFRAKDVYHVLKNNTGTEKVQAIFFNCKRIGKQNLDRADFKMMYNLRLLGVYSFDVRKLNITLSLPNSLRYLSWEFYPWKSLPPEFSLENLVELHLPCSRVTQLWDGGQNPMNLKVIELDRCTRLTALPNLSGSPNIERIILESCKSLVEIPQYLKNIDKLTYLDLSQCKRLKYLPEMPRNIESLSLQGSGIKELPSICKFKSHEKLDLSYCFNLEVVPSSIYKLTNIKTLSFSYCKNLRNFPQPTGSVGFLSLEVLNLEYSGILEIPEGLICSTSLRVLDLEGSKIRSIPSSIKQASQLSCLHLYGCKSLRSLPELPMLSSLAANGCKSLKTVSSSRTAITQCWNRYDLLREELNFCKCVRLGDDARSNIMVDAQLRIMRVATASSKLKEEEEDYERFSSTGSSILEEENFFRAVYDCKRYSGPLVTIVCPGDEIPNWFVHQNEGASINVRLPANWFREGFLGFALSVVASNLYAATVSFECKYNFKTGEGESHEINCPFNFAIHKDVEELFHFAHLQHVFVLYKDLEYVERTKWSSAFYDCVTEVSVHFLQMWGFKAKMCGMCLLYAEDAEKLKCDVMSRQEQDEHAASGSGDPEASGSNESEEVSGSDDSEESSGRYEYEQASGSDESDASGSD